MFAVPVFFAEKMLFLFFGGEEKRTAKELEN
jgi:hypothetical protein